MDRVRARIESLHDLPAPPSVPCHLDYGSHNWLVDRLGLLRVIAFAGAHRQVWTRDLVRLQFSSWWGRPDLRVAFLDGYGRQLDAGDAQLLLSLGTLVGVSRLVWSGDPSTTSPTSPRTGDESSTGSRRTPDGYPTDEWSTPDGGFLMDSAETALASWIEETVGSFRIVADHTRYGGGQVFELRDVRDRGSS